MRITVCELPHEPAAVDPAWSALCDHTARSRSELVLLPEFAMLEPVWEAEQPDPVIWATVEAQSERQLERLPELGVEYVVGARPLTRDGRRLNQGFLWSQTGGLAPLRSKYFLPNFAQNWEGRWFDRGDPALPAFQAGELTFGLSICTELWAVETYARYAAAGVHAILSPRATAVATADKWLALGIVAAARSGAYSISSNRVDSSGAGGGASWVIGPDGKVLVRTSAAAPFATLDLDLAVPAAARSSYPCSVFAAEGEPAGSAVAAAAGLP